MTNNELSKVAIAIGAFDTLASDTVCYAAFEKANEAIGFIVRLGEAKRWCRYTINRANSHIVEWL